MNWNLDDYFVEIEGKFAARRGRSVTISPQDWILIEGWQHQGIPLHVVLAAIDEVFDRQKDDHLNRRRFYSINSLSYCREAVEKRFAAWSENRVGAHEPEQLALISADEEDREIDRLEFWLNTNNLYEEYLTAEFKRVKEIARQFAEQNEKL